MDAWLIWPVIAALLLVIEMLTLTAALAMLGVAALITAGLAALGLPVPVQLLAFTVTATFGVLLVRPVVRRAMVRPQLQRFGGGGINR
jgi:membrane protein implicated in regulation of membrane protease activity